MPTRSDRAKRLRPSCAAFLSAVAAPESSRINPMRFQRCNFLISARGTPNPVKMRSVCGIVSFLKSASVPVTVPGLTFAVVGMSGSFGGCRRT
eukprot:29661-Pelagococcus_subviridis.AAC.6